MSNDAKGSTGPQFSSAPLITSAVLVGVGTFFIFTGLAVGGSHLLSATDDVGVVDQAVNHGGGDGVVAEDLPPES